MILIKTFVVGLEKGFLNSFYSVNVTLLSLALLVKDIYNAFYFNPPLVPLWFLMGSSISVTRSGDFLDFGQLFKAFGNN